MTGDSVRGRSSRSSGDGLVVKMLSEHVLGSLLDLLEVLDDLLSGFALRICCGDERMACSGRGSDGEIRSCVVELGESLGVRRG